MNTLGLKLIRNQCALGQEVLDAVDTDRSRQKQLRGREEFEALPKDRYAALFETCHRVMPDDGRTVLQFMRFIAKEIFPGGAVPCDEDVVEYSERAAFAVEQLDYLTTHYVRTLDIWSQRLEATRTSFAVAFPRSASSPSPSDSHAAPKTSATPQPPMPKELLTA